jgi:hypothetical protein
MLAEGATSIPLPPALPEADAESLSCRETLRSVWKLSRATSILWPLPPLPPAPPLFAVARLRSAYSWALYGSNAGGGATPPGGLRRASRTRCTWWGWGCARTSKNTRGWSFKAEPLPRALNHHNHNHHNHYDRDHDHDHNHDHDHDHDHDHGHYHNHHHHNHH